MGINITDNRAPDADVGGERDITNNDTYEPTDDNANGEIASSAPASQQDN